MTAIPLENPSRSISVEDMVQVWYADFVYVDPEDLLELMWAANYMKIKQLLDLTSLALSLRLDRLLLRRNPGELQEFVHRDGTLGWSVGLSREEIERDRNLGLL